MKKTTFYQKKNHHLSCQLCPWNCSIQEGERGRCGVRENVAGVLYEKTYPQVAALALDPVEKKPLYHFYPGSSILSLGMTGCNLSCIFCQNWHLSQGKNPREGQELFPGELVEKAGKMGSLGLAFTYSEPLIFFEYLKEAASLAQEEGLMNVLITNGFIQEGPLQEILPYIQGVNLDIKAFREDFYQKYCGGSLAVVLNTARILVEAGVHLEVTNLIIPTLNDSREELADLFSFLSHLKEEMPLHLSRYFPSYGLQIPPTPKETLLTAYEMAREELPFVYLGNLPQGQYQTTFCPQCQGVLIKRYPRLVIYARGGCCPDCGYLLTIPGLTSS